ncbi:MAG TPA: response regulator [Thermoanaerobaculia bacterium]|nr:response regulator [Thermoanaerobaculia bacterium]
MTDSPAATASPMEVLVVEDDAAIRRLLAVTFKHEGMTVTTARDGVEAIDALKERRFRVLVLDLMMPRVSGWDVIEWLKSEETRKPKSVIVVSATNRDVIRELEPAVVNAIVFKPFDVNELTGYVKACCGPTDDRRSKRMVGD